MRRGHRAVGWPIPAGAVIQREPVPDPWKRLGGRGLLADFADAEARSPATLVSGFGIFTLVACWEENLFRGFVFQRLVEGLGVWPAQALLALLFGVAHWSNPGMHGATKAWATLDIALAAVFLGLAYLRTRSLALPVGIHLGWNWMQGHVLGFGVSGTTTAHGWVRPVFHGRPEWVSGGAFGLEASAACTLVCGVAILGLWGWRGVSGGVSTASES